jgi:uncharacterized protein YlaI
MTLKEKNHPLQAYICSQYHFQIVLATNQLICWLCGTNQNQITEVVSRSQKPSIENQSKLPCLLLKIRANMGSLDVVSFAYYQRLAVKWDERIDDGHVTRFWLK